MQSIAQRIELQLLEPVKVGGVQKHAGDRVSVSRNAAKVLMGEKKARIWTEERAAAKEEAPKPLDSDSGVEYSADVPAEADAEKEPERAEQEAPTGRAAKRIPRNQR